jgi:hypothetical protein
MHAQLQTLTVRDEGLLIPRQLLFSTTEWIVVTHGQEIILRPQKNKQAAHQHLMQIREQLRQKYGEMPDSTPLIKEMRDEQ